MSVDFSPCNLCGTTFCECGPHSSCDTCGQKLCGPCSDKLKLFGPCSDKLKVGGNMKDKPADDEKEDYQQCPFCSGQIVSDEDLLEYLIMKSNKTRAELESEFRSAYST